MYLQRCIYLYTGVYIHVQTYKNALLERRICVVILESERGGNDKK